MIINSANYTAQKLYRLRHKEYPGKNYDYLGCFRLVWLAPLEDNLILL